MRKLIALKNTFPDIIKQWDDLKLVDNSNKPNIAELMESEAGKLLKEFSKED
jgi:hypothetical protein